MNREELRQYIVDNWSDYLALTKKNCESYHESMTIENHEAHNKDLDYQKYMIGIISSRPEHWKDKKALDFGCGCGRNVKNLLAAADWMRVDGCDVSKKNADYTKKHVSQFFAPERCKTWKTNGYTLSTDAENEYDFVMSHIVFQHIANWHIRYSILSDMYKVLKPGGILNIHFMDFWGALAYHDSYPPADITASEFFELQRQAGYSNIVYQGNMENIEKEFKETFGENEWKPVNCMVGDPNYIAEDLYNIGFRTVGISTVVDPYSKQNAYYIGALK